MTAPIFMNVNTSEPTPKIILSWGMGEDSTSVLLRWLKDPTSRDFDLKDLAIVTAQTGNEWQSTRTAVETLILPRIAAAGVRFIQAARARRHVTKAGDGVVILDDSRSPTRLYLEGEYTLWDEMTEAGTIPQTGGARMCIVDCTNRGEEWDEFEEHFDKRKVELGSCGRPYGTPCSHEHSCIRCPMLHVNPKMVGRLDELESDLLDRRQRALTEGWKGEIEGIDLTLQCLRDKRDETKRMTRTTTTISLGMPVADDGAARKETAMASDFEEDPFAALD